MQGDADISVTAVQVLALRAARNAGLKVAQSTIDRAIAYMKRCANNPDGGFSYQATGLIDPFGQRTALFYNFDGTLQKIQEPGGRSIEITYKTVPWFDPWGQHERVIDYIQASGKAGQ